MASYTIVELQKHIEKLGLQVVKDSANRLIVYTEDKERVSTLQLIATSFDGKYLSQKSGSGWKSSKGAAQIGNVIVIAKPVTQGTAGNIATLDARVFTAGGQSTDFEYMGKLVRVKTFTKADDLKNSILDGIAGNRLLGNSYAELFQDFFASNKIKWPPDTPAPVINKLGVYLGEVLVGWAFLSKQQRTFFSNNPFTGTVKAFHVPVDPAFSGVDSFVEMSDGTYYSISSKFGGGAKASIFSNLVDKGVTVYNLLDDSVFKDICKTANEVGDAKKSRDIVYSYGVKYVLGLDSNQLKYPFEVYNQIVKGETKTEAAKAIVKVSELTDNSQIKEQLPYSVSAFFNREIAERLNNDGKSLDQIREILTGKDYFQANLNIREWAAGNVKFKFLSSREAKVKIIGSKSAIGDITSKQGWINYELSY